MATALPRTNSPRSEPPGAITANPHGITPASMAAPALTIVNGHAGGGRAARRAPAVLAELRRRGVKLDVRLTKDAGHAIELAREGYAAGYRRFLAVGGDGTTYEVLNGVFPRPAEDTEPVTIGQLPLGTGNSYLRDFAITEERAALHALIEGKERLSDIVRVKHRDGEFSFLNLLAVGFPAQVCELTNRRFKPLGAAGYAVSVVASLFAMKRPLVEMTVDGLPERKDYTFVSFSNSGFTGGSMNMAPGASVSDGLVDIIRCDPMNALTLVQAFSSIYAGTHTSRPDVAHTKAAKVEFAPTAAPWDVMVDGEVMKVHLESLEVIPGAVRVIA